MFIMVYNYQVNAIGERLAGYLENIKYLYNVKDLIEYVLDYYLEMIDNNNYIQYNNKYLVDVNINWNESY